MSGYNLPAPAAHCETGSHNVSIEDIFANMPLDMDLGNKIFGSQNLAHGNSLDNSDYFNSGLLDNSSVPGSFLDTTAVNGGFLGMTSGNDAYLGGPSFQDSYLGTSSVENSFPGMTSGNNPYLGAPSLEDSYPGTSSLESSFPVTSSINDSFHTTSATDNTLNTISANNDFINTYATNDLINNSANDDFINNFANDDFLNTVSATDIPDIFGNDLFGNNLHWNEPNTGNCTGAETSFPSNIGAEQLNANGPAPFANIGNHQLTSAELQAPSAKEFPAFQDSSVADTHRAPIREDAMSMEQQQLLCDFLGKPRHPVFNSDVSPHTRQQNANASYSSGPVNVVETLQSNTNNTHWNSNQQLQPLGQQAHFAAGAQVHMSPEQLHEFKKHMAREVQKPGMTEQEKIKLVASIPGHLMDALSRDHPMPLPRQQAPLPQVTAQPPQQTGPTNEQPAKPSRAPAPTDGAASAPSRKPAKKQSQRTPRQPRDAAPRPRRRRPAPVAVPKFQEMTAQECCELLPPTPSPTTEEGTGLSRHTYQPLTEHVLPPLDPNNPPAYPAYSGLFKTGGQATRFRKRVRIPPKEAGDLERVRTYGRLFWVRELYNSMIDCREVIDGKKSTKGTRLQKLFWNPADLEATAHDIFDAAIKVHARGWTRQAVYHKRTVRGKLVDTAIESVEKRLSKICNLLRTSKAVVDDCMRSGITLALVVDNPKAREATKKSNNLGNGKRGTKLWQVRRLEKKQGRPLTAAQWKKVDLKFKEPAPGDTAEDEERANESMDEILNESDDENDDDNDDENDDDNDDENGDEGDDEGDENGDEDVEEHA